MTSKDEYWSAVKARFNELVADFKNRCEESIEPEYLYDIRLGKIQKLWSWSDWIVAYNGNEPVYDGGHLRYVYKELVSGERDYDDPAHLELDAYLQFEKWLNRRPTYWSISTAGKSQKSVIISPVSKQDDQSLETLVNVVEEASSSKERDSSLENLISRLFETIPGFKVTERSVRTATEEIDIVVLNNSNDPRFRREEAIILVECKNWSEKCDKNEFVLFKEKIENRSARCSIGFLVSWNGFKDTVSKEMLRGSRERTLIVTVIGKDIREAVRNNNFADVLLSCWERAIST